MFFVFSSIKYTGEVASGCAWELDGSLRLPPSGMVLPLGMPHKTNLLRSRRGVIVPCSRPGLSLHCRGPHEADLTDRLLVFSAGQYAALSSRSGNTSRHGVHPAESHRCTIDQLSSPTTFPEDPIDRLIRAAYPRRATLGASSIRWPREVK